MDLRTRAKTCPGWVVRCDYQEVLQRTCRVGHSPWSRLELQPGTGHVHSPPRMCAQDRTCGKAGAQHQGHLRGQGATGRLPRRCCICCASCSTRDSSSGIALTPSRSQASANGGRVCGFADVDHAWFTGLNQPCSQRSSLTRRAEHSYKKLDIAYARVASTL